MCHRFDEYLAVQAINAAADNFQTASLLRLTSQLLDGVLIGDTNGTINLTSLSIGGYY